MRYEQLALIDEKRARTQESETKKGLLEYSTRK